MLSEYRNTMTTRYWQNTVHAWWQIPSTRYSQNTEAQMNTTQSQKPWHDVHRPSLQNTRYYYSGVWMYFVWSTHHSLSGAACCNPILVSLPVNYQGLRNFADAGQVGSCGFPYQVRGLAGIDWETIFIFFKVLRMKLR